MRDRTSARARAIRAAHAVTLGLATAASGCAASHEGGEREDGGRRDDAAIVADAGSDAGPLTCPPVYPPTTQACCEAEPGGHWDAASNMCWIAVPGPFVPPSMEHAHA